jgi:hypothetical protein
LIEPKLVAAVLCVAGVTACDAPVCVDDEREDSRLSSGLQGTLLLPDAQETRTIRLRASLSHLPELWRESTLRTANADLAVYIGYESAPVGGDGSTEMPSFEIGFEPAERGVEATRTPSLPQNPFLLRRRLFETCPEDDDPYCCRFGEPECSLPVTVQIEREQGAPFPPVVVEWHSSVTASVSSCPEPNRAELTFEQETGP